MIVCVLVFKSLFGLMGSVSLDPLFILLSFEVLVTVSRYVAQTFLILLCLPPKFRNYRCVPLHPAALSF